jgi:hypothetical protein
MNPHLRLVSSIEVPVQPEHSMERRLERRAHTKSWKQKPDGSTYMLVAGSLLITFAWLAFLIWLLIKLVSPVWR